MPNRPIGFFDSGLGGVSVLKYAKQIMPNENFIYLERRKAIKKAIETYYDREIL